MKDYTRLIQLRADKNFNKVLLVTSVIGFIGSAFLYLAELPIIYAALNFITGILMLSLYVMAEKFPTSIKIISMITVSAIIACASFIGGGFSSAFITMLILSNVVAVIFLEQKKSITISIISVALMFSLAYYSIYHLGFQDIIDPIIVWSLQLVAFILCIIVLHISVYSMKSYLIENIEGIEEAMVKTNELAYFDQLTSLPNTIMFKQMVKERIDDLKCDGYFLFFSLKSLNLINSTLGHEMGNQTLIESTKLFKEYIGHEAIIARTGGNEFIIWIDGISEEQCFIKFSKLLNELETQSHILRKKLEFHSVFSKYIYGDETIDECYQKAVLTLTYAKHNNVHGLLSYNDHLEEEFRRKEMIKDHLEHALYNGEITLHYQEKIDIRNAKVVGVEGLARWKSEELGVVTPNEFIPIIESMNLSTTFGEFVINKVCKDYRQLVEKYDSELSISINISPSHIMDPNIIISLKEALIKYNVDPKSIVIEITEDIIIKGIDQVKPILGVLRDMGIRISLDDFGTGYSSLNYLSLLDLDELKIDKSFVDQISNNKRILILIENIINLSKQLNLTVIAEGVETKEQNDVLEELGCYIIQGYYYSKPEKI